MAELRASLPALGFRALLASYAVWCFAGALLLLHFDAFNVLGVFVAWLAAVVLACRWLHLAVRHARARGIEVGLSADFAVLLSLMPIANCFVPFQLVRRMSKAVKVSTVRVWVSQVLTLTAVALVVVSPRHVGVALVGVALVGAAITAGMAIRSLRFE